MYVRSRFLLIGSSCKLRTSRSQFCGFRFTFVRLEHALEVNDLLAWDQAPHWGKKEKKIGMGENKKSASGAS